MERSRVAILLVTPEFLASDFIAHRELPPILEAAEQRGLTLMWIAVKVSAYEETPIRDYQAANDPRRPLDELSSSEQDRALLKIGQELKAALEEG